MEEIQRRWKKKKQSFKIYTQEEANSLLIPYVYWKNVKLEPYALTDDGYVADVLNVQIYTDRGTNHTRKLVTLSCGKNFDGTKSTISYTANKVYKYWSNISPVSWQQRESRMGRTKNAVKVYVKQIFTGGVNWEQLGQVYRPDQKAPIATVKRLFRQEKIKDMVSQEIQKECADRGITPGYVLDIVKRAIELAENREDASNMLKGAHQLQEYVDLFPKNEQTSGFEVHITKELGEAVQRADKELAEKIENAEEVPT